MNKRPCPVCKRDALVGQVSGKLAFAVQCDRCGRFILTNILISNLDGSKMMLPPDDLELLPYLSAHTRQASEGGTIVELSTENWQELARSHKRTPVSRKLVKFLELVAAQSAFPGHEVEMKVDLDYPLLDARSADEVGLYAEHWLDRGYLGHGPAGSTPSYSITVKGWEYLESLGRGGGVPGRCFVAMSFVPELEDAYNEGIAPAVRDCGFDPIKIDRVHHNEKICDKILAEIRMAQFLVADFTGHRAGVYFEAGFAVGLGRPVIWTCRHDQLAQTHFDTRQYNHIVWSGAEELRTLLRDRILATIPGAKL